MRADWGKRSRGKAALNGGFVSYVYAVRKEIFFAVLHFIATMACWQHFAYTMFKIQEAKAESLFHSLFFSAHR